MVELWCHAIRVPSGSMPAGECAILPLSFGVEYMLFSAFPSGLMSPLIVPP